MAEAPKHITTIQSTQSRPSARQTLLDQGQAQRRRKRAGAFYGRVEGALNRMTGGRPTRAALMELAAGLGGPRGIIIDRLARRMKEVLICWFCENWDRLNTPLQKVEEQEPAVSAVGDFEVPFQDDGWDFQEE
jgi:hypothetical protein